MEEDRLQEQPSPVDDRDEFERRIRRGSCWTEFYNLKEVIEYLLEGNQPKIDEIKSLKQACENHCNDLLRQYDEAVDRKAKEQVVGSVKRYKPE